MSGPIFLWGSLSRVVSVQGGLCPGWSLSRVVSVQGGLCPWGVSVQLGASVQGWVCPVGLCQGDVRDTPGQRPLLVKSGQYATYWNAVCSQNLDLNLTCVKGTIIQSNVVE